MAMPPGVTPEALLAMLRSVRQDNTDGAELSGYLERDWRRFAYSWQLCRDVRGTCLELGASPYFTTVLLREFTDLQLALTNYFGPALSDGVDVLHYDSLRYPDADACRFAYDNFNIETDRFPYPDASFDLVLCCEIIEHLTHDPLPALREIKRVLKPGGRLVLTTPNVGAGRNLLKLIRGGNIYDRYSGYGPYGRHNREYTKSELVDLLARCGLIVDQAFTADVKKPGKARRVGNLILRMMVGLFSRERARCLGQYIFLSAVSAGEAQSGRPSWLYRSFDDGV
ncbi:MAG: methyltransferase domain-containing protein [Sphingobium sp.]